ncbi:protein-L-isoaspartate O-methyltransferase family protein [Granulosicoccus antarcticus]|uniref:Protein-L-isoaspartate O-methyltransferase n=1 Tax=Granulosicoccus antarcticus IMCC3135 TaxID=1192854 RepID=A0A2Z2NK31_9GAMM|nr:protein-L-isoaspartate O-methyltransferase [Granulosicoccus antarcticus]ASJ71483.1 Protein-L-isoaspartate O-methyltransferase [Granulosicoccus antarcticus IMCC3135]
MDLQQARNNMIEQQVRPWDVLDQHVLDVLSLVPRDSFLEPAHQGIAYSDYPLPIGHGQHMLKPTVDGRLLQALLLELTDTVLEIGTGSGYLTACLARLCAHVDSIEIIPELADAAKARLQTMGVSNVTVLHQDATSSWDARDGYNAIAFSGAIPSIPDFYRNKLKIGGRLFALIGDTSQPTMEAVLVTRVSETEWSRESLFETNVDPLVNFDSETPSFVF